MTSHLRVFDVSVIFCSMNGGDYPGFCSQIVGPIPLQPLVKVIIKACDKTEYVIGKKNKKWVEYYSDAVPLYMVYNDELVVYSRRNKEEIEKVSSFGARAVELMRNKADLMFHQEPQPNSVFWRCGTCDAIMSSSNPVDYARHVYLNGTCTGNKAWTAMVENEQLRIMYYRAQQRIEFLIAKTHASCQNMFGSLQDVAKI